MSKIHLEKKNENSQIWSNSDWLDKIEKIWVQHKLSSLSLIDKKSIQMF